MKLINSTIHALSPIDGRYAEQTAELKPIFSEFGLMRYRLLIEIKWLLKLASEPQIKDIKPLSKKAQKFLINLFDNFNDNDAKQVKLIEQKTNHDVKSIEYFLKEKIKKHTELSRYSEFLHFALTSEDINNLAYALMIQEARTQCLLPAMHILIQHLSMMANNYADIPMLSHTHGQPATPTTVGKELANFVVRLDHQYREFSHILIQGKFNGTVGNFNAHFVAFPEVDWENICQDFVEDFGLTFNTYTTQIEPHDYIAELCHALIRFNNILLGLNRDIWNYIALNYFTQKSKKTEIGSSTMPHKINPIDFENSEGNLGLANVLMEHFANKLTISRWQRDLSDSTVMRNIGVTFAHSLLAYQSTFKGLNKLAVNTEFLEHELEQHYEVLAEAIQTVMRRYSIDKPYEKLKALTRGKKIDTAKLVAFIDELALPNNVKLRLKQLTPKNYLGIAVKLAKMV